MNSSRNQGWLSVILTFGVGGVLAVVVILATVAAWQASPLLGALVILAGLAGVLWYGGKRQRDREHDHE